MDDFERAARAKKGSPFLSTEQAAFYLGLSAAQDAGDARRPASARAFAATAATSATISMISTPGRERPARPRQCLIPCDRLCSLRAGPSPGASARPRRAAPRRRALRSRPDRRRSRSTLLWPPRAGVCSGTPAPAALSGSIAVSAAIALAAPATWSSPGRRPRRARLGAERHYLPAGVPLVKRVAAVARRPRLRGQARPCSSTAALAALRRARDRAGRPMPWWSGCEVLRAGDLFLLSSSCANAFDGRYFGVTRSRPS